MKDSKPRNISRTWETVTEHRPHGEYWGDTLHTVTLTADQHGTLTAQLDGQPVPVADAVRVLHYATRTELIREERTPEPAPVIGKPRAARLHRLMGRVGLPSAQHYALAAAALGEWAPLHSLATLTEQEARAVWVHLCRLYPQARTAA
ncbi:hypothetical protein [Deinococcus sp. RM]|uniref:hypothetical protein n=1 Tax=Deinococcus sp. RM TaxID=2316359 RepID=UPI000E68956E|nr:hypothetical protein [Deinococcus sp. RM]RIY03992.1 hypothetical protein D3W47_12655 [Deinococcus sp. RM]